MSKTGFLSPQKRELLNRVLAQKGIQAPAQAHVQAHEAIPVRPAADRSRLSFSQQRLWVLDRLQPGLSAYNVPVVFQLDGRLDLGALCRSFNAVLERHRVLCATFEDAQGEPVQRFRRLPEVAIPLVDLAALEAPEGEPRAMERVAREIRRPFDLARDLLVRPRLLRLAPDLHLFTLTMHHIVSDAWSVGIFSRELAALYQAHAAGRPARLPELPIQYSDFAEWQRGAVQEEALRKQLEYWRHKLAGDLPLLELPADHPRGPLQTFQGTTETFSVDPGTAEALKALGRRHGATLFMVLLAAFDLLLHRYTGHRDLLVGSAIAGRNRPELESVMGCFVNTLVLRNRLAPEAGFEELLRRVKETVLEAFAHQDLPFERLVETLQPQRSINRSPFFQVMFGLQNVPEEQIEVPGLVVRRINLHHGAAKFDLTLLMREADDRLLGSIEYNLRLFEPATIRRFKGHFQNLLRSIARSPSRPVGRLALLGPGERRQMLDDWQGPSAPLPTEPVHELFRRQALATPEAPALRFAEGAFSFGELAAQADRLASLLRPAGVGPESRVGLFLERSPEMVAALWGILAAGGAYVPLDPAAPARRTAFQIEDAALATVLTREALGRQLPSSGARVIPVDGMAVDATAVDATAVDASEAGEAPARPVEMDNLAYVLYTSGSTGRPKGVQVSHGALAGYLLNWCIPAYRVADGQGAPLHSSLGFDLTVTGLLAPLLAGRPVSLVSRREELEELAEQLAGEADFSLVKLTPAHMEILNHLLGGAGKPGSTRALVVGGEALPARTVADWKGRNSRTRIFNEYGPTEAVVGCSVHEVTGDEGRAGTVAIGRPITNARIYLLDGCMEPVPMGAAGEIHIGGPGLARGYLRRPSLTAERFVPDPFGGATGARLYRTGDLARHRPDGTLLFLGRIDDQVKLRGYRIEPGEIEAALGRLPAVREAVVGLAPAASGGDQLVAYLVARGETRPEVSELQAALREWLPDYMIPSAFSFVDAFPLTSHGKVDRKALADSHPAKSARSTPYVAPRTPLEEILTTIWAEVLGVERVGVEDDFFELGGHSLLALKVSSRTRRALNVEVALPSVFAASTVADLVRRIEEESAQESAPAAPPPLEKADRSAPLPLSFAQQRLWFLDRLAPGDPSYNIPYPLRFRGDLEVGVLRRALDEIVRRHEVLRTRYPTLGGEPRQQVQVGVEAPLFVVDLRRHGDPPSAAREAVQREVRRPFDLARGPLFRITLFQVDEGDFFSVLVLHHIVTDAWSMDLFVGELVTLYTAFSRRQPSPLEELPYQYADFAAWQRRLLTPEVVSAQLEHWKQELGERPPVLQLPTDRPRRIRMQVEGRRRSHSFPRRLREALHQVSGRHGLTPFMTTLAAFQVLLHRYSGQRAFVVGTPVAERGDRALDGIIGLFLNMLPIRADLAGDPTPAELLQRVRTISMDAFAHQQLPFERLVEAFQSQRDLARTPLFQVLFTFQHASPQVFELPGVEIRSLDVSTRTARFDVTLFVIDTGQDLEARVEYDAGLFDGTTIGRMLRHLEAVLESMSGDLELPVSRLPLLSAEERQCLLRDWNQTAGDFPRQECLHTLIARRVEEEPGALAVEDPSTRLTYRELDRRANRLARFLRRAGVGPEVPVGLCVERSCDALVGILGILKAGGAYLPLDPAYPIERLSHMVRDSETRLVLTQQRLLSRLPARDARVCCLDSDWEDEIAPLPDDPLENPASPENLAYLIYTSGSTGKPKGTMVSHRSVINHSLAMGKHYGLHRGSRFSQLFSLSFDGSVEDLFPPLLAGSALLCHPNPTRHTLGEVLGFYGQRGVSVLHLPTALWHHFAAELHRGKVELPPSVRITSAGGEALAVDKLREYLEDTGGTVPFLNVYGPTEATVTASVVKVRGGDGFDYPGRNLPIGRPLPNVTLYVLDRDARPVPRGVAGELFIGGVCVTRGYLGRPGLTAERFVPDPFAGDGSRLYRTGDLVRHQADGILEYLGRIDKQVKIRSFRVELAEIEAAVAEHPAISDVVVEVQTHGEDDQRIVAYVIPAGEPPATAELRRHLERFLPAYMIPSALVPLESFPLTPNGKIDRARLPRPRYGEQSSQAFVAPRTPAEAKVAEIWKEVLQIGQVGVEDNFFELGGHSLLAVRVHERLEAGFQREIPLIRLFEHSTVARLAGFLAPEAGDGRGETTLEDSEEWADARRQALRRQRAARRARASLVAE